MTTLGPLPARIASMVAHVVKTHRQRDLNQPQALTLVTDLNLLQDLMTIGTGSPDVRDRVLAAYDKGLNERVLAGALEALRHD